jgi:hypothetical protein
LEQQTPTSEETAISRSQQDSPTQFQQKDANMDAEAISMDTSASCTILTVQSGIGDKLHFEALNDSTSLHTHQENENSQENKFPLKISNNNLDSSHQDLKLQDLKLDKNGLNFMHLNIHYLYPKFSEIQFLVDNLPDIDILGLQETFLSDAFSNNEIN